MLHIVLRGIRRDNATINISRHWEKKILRGFRRFLQARRLRSRLPDNIANLIDETFIFQILVLDYGQLLEKLPLFTGQ
jgi:hypothetical protein